MSEEIIKPNKALGEAIVAEAEQQQHEELKQAVINNVVNYKNIIGKIEKMIKKLRECQEFNKDKISALKEGEFNFDTETGELIFHDKRLNIYWETVQF